MKRLFLVVMPLCLCLAPVEAADPTITGDYVEARTSDVYTGPCFANGEMNLTGKEAILAWRVRKGSWNGTSLDGLSVVAVLRARATLGDPHADPRPTQSVLIVDEHADPVQQEALVRMARTMASNWLDEVVWVKAAPIEMVIDSAQAAGHHGHGQTIARARLRAGDMVEFQSRSLHAGDHFCGNEIVFYPPLIDVQAEPAYTLVHRFDGEGLNATWSSPFKRSAFIGQFSR